MLNARLEECLRELEVLRGNLLNQVPNQQNDAESIGSQFGVRIRMIEEGLSSMKKHVHFHGNP